MIKIKILKIGKSFSLNFKDFFSVFYDKVKIIKKIRKLNNKIPLSTILHKLWFNGHLDTFLDTFISLFISLNNCGSTLGHFLNDKSHLKTILN